MAILELIVHDDFQWAIHYFFLAIASNGLKSFVDVLNHKLPQLKLGSEAAGAFIVQQERIIQLTFFDTCLKINRMTLENIAVL